MIRHPPFLLPERESSPLGKTFLPLTSPFGSGAFFWLYSQKLVSCMLCRKQTIQGINLAGIPEKSIVAQCVVKTQRIDRLCS